MKKQIAAALLLGLGVFCILGLYKFFSIRAAIAESMKFGPPPETITSYETKEELWSSEIHAAGSLTAFQGAVLAAEMSGQVSHINFEPGQQVAKDQLLISLNSAAEQAQLEGAKANFTLAQKELQRAQVLREKNANSLADLDLARARMADAQAAVTNLEQIIRKKSITAPFSGTAGIRTINVGDFVKEGQELLPVFNSEKLYVDFQLPQSFINQVKMADNVEVSLTGQALSIFGKVTAINPNINNATRNFSLRAEIDNYTGELRPGMFVKIKVQTSNPQKVIPIPASAVSYAPYGNSVWVIDQAKDEASPQRPAKQQFVKLGIKKGDFVAVGSGLAAGQEIVSSGVFKMRPGVMVIVNNSIQPEQSQSPNLPNS